MSKEIEEASVLIRHLMDYAYEQGFHECGYDPLSVLLSALQPRPVEIEPDGERIRLEWKSLIARHRSGEDCGYDVGAVSDLLDICDRLAEENSQNKENAATWHRMVEAIATVLEADSSGNAAGIGNSITTAIQSLREDNARWLNARDVWEAEKAELRRQVDKLTGDLLGWTAGPWQPKEWADNLRTELTGARAERERLREALHWALDSGVVKAVHFINGNRMPRLVNMGDFDSVSPPQHLLSIFDEALSVTHVSPEPESIRQVSPADVCDECLSPWPGAHAGDCRVANGMKPRKEQP